MKTCSNCKEEKPFDAFNKSKNHRHGLHPFCKLCRSFKTKKYMEDPIRRQRSLARSAAWVKANPERSREIKANWNRYNLYGLTPERYNQMLEEQQYRCLSCNREEPLVVDHNHDTGEVRGLICNKCNITVGFIEGDRYNDALTYLRKFSG